MKRWILECEKCKPAKLRSFLSDFAEFLNLEETVSIENVTTARVAGIISARASNTDADSNEFDAVLAVYEIRDRIPLYAIKSCLERARDRLKMDFPGWRVEVVSDFDSREPYIYMKLEKPSWEGHLWIYLGSQYDEKNGCHFDLCICKEGNFSPVAPVSFDAKNHMLIGPSKNGYMRNPRPLGVKDLRSTEGIRALLTDQAAMDIVTEVGRVIEEYEPTMDSCSLSS